MKTTFLKPITLLLSLTLFIACKANTDGPEITYDSMIIDHNCTNIFDVPVKYIEAAKKQLVIAYGHTSHGSQLITGMDGLQAFMTSHKYTEGLFAFNSDGSNNALQLQDSPFEDAYDLGNPNFTEWENATRKYLKTHNEINVIMWSWCGQAAWASTDEIDNYLSLMTGLENDYPKIKFVYMTCHLDGSGKEGQLNQNNEHIRNYCKTNKKILFDFADIESYDPDGKVNYMELYANDNCDYTTTSGDSKNWAIDWQNSHTENTDWYNCEPAHTQALNGNRKAYAAWWMFARMAGWNSNEGTSIASTIKNEKKLICYSTSDYLKVILPQMTSASLIELFDIQGKLLYHSNHNSSGNSILIPLTDINYKMNKPAIIWLIAENKCFSGKINLNTF